MKKVLKITGKIIRIKILAIIFVLLPVLVFLLLSAKTEIFGIKSYIVLTGSMQPTIPTGSVIFTQRVAEYNKGDVITFQQDNKKITHRIVDAGNGQYITQGDANNSVDTEPVSKSSILGKTIFHLPELGKFLSYLRTPQGFIAFIIFPGALFVVMELWAIKNEIVKNTEKRVRAALQKETQIQMQ